MLEFINDLHLITGNVVGKINFREFPDGNRVLNFSVAVDKGYMRDGDWIERTKYYSVSAWNKRADNLKNRNLVSGDLITIRGDVEGNSYLDKNNPENIIQSIALIVESYKLLRRGKSKPEAMSEAGAGGEENIEEAEEEAIRAYNLQTERNKVFDLEE